MANLTVSYKQYNHFNEVPTSQIPKLKKLTKGKYGLMAGLVTAYEQGYMWDEYKDGNWNYEHKWDAMQRSIIVAYSHNTPIGWCITDDEGLLNLFVHRSYRKIGIAQNLAYLWGKQNMKKVTRLMRGDRWTVVHTDEADMLVRAAALRLGITKTPRRRKYTKVTHNLPV